MPIRYQDSGDGVVSASGCDVELTLGRFNSSPFKFLRALSFPDLLFSGWRALGEHSLWAFGSIRWTRGFPALQLDDAGLDILHRYLIVNTTARCR